MDSLITVHLAAYKNTCYKILLGWYLRANVLLAFIPYEDLKEGVIGMFSIHYTFSCEAKSQNKFLCFLRRDKRQ